MKYFTNITTLDDLKKAYRRLAFTNHPDRGGDVATMQAINAEYEQLHELLKNQHNSGADEYHQTTETAAEFIQIINVLVRMGGLEIELCGSWLWIGGNTREHKGGLKTAGCRWSSNKKLWYWHHEEAGRKWRKGNTTMQEIRRKYGSQVYTAAGESSKYEKIGATA